MKAWFNGEWFWDITCQRLVYIPRGEYEPDRLIDVEAIENKIVINREAYFDLLEFIKENERGKGILRTDREEDLKLINRLVDIIEKGVEKQ